VPWITSYLAGLSRRRPEFDPGRSGAGTGFFPVTVIPPMPHNHLHLTTTPIRNRNRRDLGNFEILGAQNTTVLLLFSSFELLRPAKGRICRAPRVYDTLLTLPHDMLFLAKPATAPSGNGVKTIILALLHGICIYDIHRQPFN
jgi:hypothetical protein